MSNKQDFSYQEMPQIVHTVFYKLVWYSVLRLPQGQQKKTNTRGFHLSSGSFIQDLFPLHRCPLPQDIGTLKKPTSTIVSPQSAFNSLIAILNTYFVYCWSHGIQSCNLLLSCSISFYRDIVSWFIYCYVFLYVKLITQLIEKLYLR